MGLRRIFTQLRNKKIDNGTAFITTESNHVIEATLYGGVIISLKSRAFSLDEIVDALSSDRIRDVNFTPSETGLSQLQPLAVEKTFLLSSPYLFETPDLSPRTLIMILRLMGHLAKAGDDGWAAFDVTAHELSKRYPKFSLESGTIQKRMQWFRDQYGIQALSSVSPGAPPEGYEVVNWVLDRAAGLSEGQITDALFCFAFFGDLLHPIFRIAAKREAGLGARNGYARASKTIYETEQDSTSIQLFRAERKLGELEVHWQSDKKPELLLTKNDLDVLHIRDGDYLNVIFKK